MHANALLLQRLFQCLDQHDHAGMAACYDSDAVFEDIAFSLRGRKRIHAMWHMIAGTDLRAVFSNVQADDRVGAVDLVDTYTFRDTGRQVQNKIRSHFRFENGLIVEHRDTCDALRWGMQALGPVKGMLSWIIPRSRRAKAAAKLEQFIAAHPEYA